MKQTLSLWARRGPGFILIVFLPLPILLSSLTLYGGGLTLSGSLHVLAFEETCKGCSPVRGSIVFNLIGFCSLSPRDCMINDSHFKFQCRGCEILQHFFEASVSSINCKINLCLKKTWHTVCFEPRSNEDKNFTKRIVFLWASRPQLYFDFIHSKKCKALLAIPGGWFD